MTRANSMLYFASSLQLREPVAPRSSFSPSTPSSAFACLDFVTRVSLSRRIRGGRFRSVYVRVEFESGLISTKFLYPLGS